jgi:hypothetical protein
METDVAERCRVAGAAPVDSVRGSDESHWGQNPIHLAERYPHELQLNVEELAI